MHVLIALILFFSMKQQVFRVFCDDITEIGLLDMLRVVKIDLKGSRHQTDSDDDEDDAPVGIEDDDDAVMEDAEVGEVDDADDVEDNEEDDSSDEGDEDQGNFKETANGTKDGNDSDDSDGMDDDAMFRIDPYIARIFKERNLPGSETKQSQLMRFKLRVLTLLEIYLQRNPGISI